MLDIILRFLNKSFGVYNFRGLQVEPTYWEAGAIIFLLFLLVLTLARLRYIYLEWHFDRHNLSFLFYGFMLALILEGFLLIGGKTFLTLTLGWKNAPKPISTVLDAGRAKLVQVLGSQTEVGSLSASGPVGSQQIISDFRSQTPDVQKLIKSSICKP